jgi:hypothetical protein
MDKIKFLSSYNTDQIHVYIWKMRTDLLSSSNKPTRGDYLGYISIKIESILYIKIDKYGWKSMNIDNNR